MVEVTDEELEALEQFKRILPDVMVMLKAGVFEFRSGHVELHRDATGRLRKVTQKQDTYIAPPDPPQTRL